MTRFTKWQREVSDAVSWHQDQALSATIFLLRETGPTSFVLEEENSEKRVRVSLGDPHTCTCDVFRRENNPCKHICWIILRKFKWPRNNDLAFQHGLAEREINLLLQGPRNSTRRTNASQQDNMKNKPNSDKPGTLEQRQITNVDVCPICQEELLTKHAPVTYCKFGCGNSIHIKCMKVWAEHQRNTSQDNEIKCPICRASFGSYYKLLEELRNSSEENDSGFDIHFSTVCTGCQMSPIKGKCYKCISCDATFLCNTCFHDNKHRQHSFEFRLKRCHRWRQAKSRHNNSGLEIAIQNDLGAREITDADYDLLLQLDQDSQQSSQTVDLSGLPLHVINSLPLKKVRAGAKLLQPGRQCRLCLHKYELGQFVRMLPDCKHIFHKDCIDTWLSEDHRRCPVDQKLVTVYRRPASKQESPQTLNHSSGDTMELMVPGVGIAKLQKSKNDDSKSERYIVRDLSQKNRRLSGNASRRWHRTNSSSNLTTKRERHHEFNDNSINSTSSLPFNEECGEDYHAADPYSITRALSGISVHEMLNTIDDVLPATRERSRNMTKRRIEKGLVTSRNNEHLLAARVNSADANPSLWLQGSSISQEENDI